MKTKIYYLFLLFMFFLMSCERTSNVSEPNITGTLNGLPILTRTVDGHDYVSITKGYTHSGTCRKCKQERDSIVNIIIETIKENKNNITWE